MKLWEILNKNNLDKTYKRKGIKYKYKVELREDNVLECISYSPYNDRMGVVAGNSMTFEWIFEETKA